MPAAAVGMMGAPITDGAGADGGGAFARVSQVVQVGIVAATLAADSHFVHVAGEDGAEGNDSHLTQVGTVVAAVDADGAFGELP